MSKGNTNVGHKASYPSMPPSSELWHHDDTNQSKTTRWNIGSIDIEGAGKFFRIEAVARVSNF